MKYTQLTQEYRDDVLADAMYAREAEFFHYEFDAKNFRKLLADTPNADLQKRLDDTLTQMTLVDSIYAALQSQVKDPVAHAAAVARCVARRSTKEATK